MTQARAPSRAELSKILHVWDELRASDAGRKAFGEFLTGEGWSILGRGGWKVAYASARFDVVVKFDMAYEKIGRRGHTIWEYLTWKDAGDGVRRHFARVWSYHRGLLIQSRVPECRHNCPREFEALRLAHEIGTSHWYHHAHTPMGIVFFDYDNLGLMEEDLERMKEGEVRVPLPLAIQI